MQTKEAIKNLVETIKYVVDKKLGEHYPELEGTELRTRYHRSWKLRDTILYGWNVNTSIVKSNRFFKRITGYEPVELALARHAGTVRDAVIDDLIIINNLRECRLTGINRVNFTLLTTSTYRFGDYNATDRFISKCKKYVQYGRTD